MLREFNWSIQNAKQTLAIRELLKEGYTKEQIWGGEEPLAINYHPCAGRSCGVCTGSRCADWTDWTDSDGIVHHGIDKERVNAFYGIDIY